VAADVAPRRHGDRDRAQQHAHEARETQEAPGTVHGVAHLGARLGDIAQPLAATLVRSEPALEVIDTRAIAGEQAAVAHAAPRLDQACGREVGGIHEEIGGQLGEGASLVGPRDEHTADAELRRTDREP